MALFATRGIAQRSISLTANEIDEAIQWGMREDPAPYLLHHVGPPGRSNPVIVAAIYTPFLRVALAAKVARIAGRTFVASDIARDVLEPVVYVAFRWYCCVDPDHGSDLATWDPSTPPLDYQIAQPGDRVSHSGSQLQPPPAPLWITRDLSLLKRYGTDLPYTDIVLIAGYPTNVLSTGTDFVIYREWASANGLGKDISMLIGRPTPDDLARWR